MSAWIRTAWAAMVLIVPGGFLFFLAFVWARALARAMERARERLPGSTVHVRDVISEVGFRDLIREARAAL